MKAIKYGFNNKGNGDPFPLKHMFVFFSVQYAKFEKDSFAFKYVKNYFKLKSKLRLRVQNNQSMFLRLRLLYLKKRCKSECYFRSWQTEPIS